MRQTASSVVTTGEAKQKHDKSVCLSIVCLNSVMNFVQIITFLHAHDLPVNATISMNSALFIELSVGYGIHCHFHHIGSHCVHSVQKV